MPSIAKIKDEKFNALYKALSEFINKKSREEKYNFINDQGIQRNKDAQLSRWKTEFENSQKLSRPKKPHNIFALNTTNRNSFLHKAVAEGNNLLIRFLINSGLDIDQPNTWHETSLYTACQYQQETAVDLLLNSGANYNAGYAKKIPLYITLDPENINLDQNEKVKAANILKKLIDKDVDINQRLGRSSLFRAIHYAVMDRRKLLVQTIVQTGKADLSIPDADGRTALHMIADYRNLNEKVQENVQMQEEREIAELIIPYVKEIKTQDKFGNTPLHTAVINSNVYVVEAIVKRDHLFPQEKILNIKNKRGMTALHEAVLEAHRGPKILNLLIQLATQDELAIKSDLIVNDYVRENAGETALEMSNRLIEDVNYSRQSAINLESAKKTFDTIRQSLNTPGWKRRLGEQTQAIYTMLDKLSSIRSENLLTHNIGNT